MHELSICENIVQIIEEEAKKQEFTEVRQIWLEIGKLSGVEIDSIKFCMDLVVRDTIAEKSKIEIIETQGQAWCMMCAKTISIQHKFDCCPECKSYQLQIVNGEELRIKEMEVN